jgi:hypothetical protein
LLEREGCGGVMARASLGKGYYFPTLFGLIETDVGFDTRGEAVFVDLGHGENLIALLGFGEYDSDSILQLVSRRFFGNVRSGTLRSAFNNLETQRDQPKTLDPSDKDPNTRTMPTLVRFRDIHDPHTIEIVDPADLGATYGPDVNLEKATFEVTNDPVTSGIIETRMPWLRDLIRSGSLPDYKASIRSARNQQALLFGGFIKE